MNTLVCFALKEEAAPFQKIAAAHHAISILITGIGRVNAKKSVTKFLADRLPQRVLTCGFAGALHSELKLGDVVFATEDKILREPLIAAGAKSVKFFSADRIVTTSAEKKQSRARTQADAVEMESEIIQTLCRERGIPCATVRAISDTADEDLPLDFNQLAKPDLNLDYGKLVWAIAKAPGKIGALLRLQKRCRFAAEQLAGVLMRVIESE